MPYVPLSAMSFAAFVYVTYEMFTVGLISPMAADLNVDESAIGLLMSIYAAVVAIITLPIMHVTRNVNRRTLFLVAFLFLIVSTAIQATAASYALLVVARISAALTHGVFWALVAPIAARISPPGNTGRAVGFVAAGSTLALVLGSPLATAIGALLGWRIATAALGVLAVGSLLTLVPTLPSLPPLHKQGGSGKKRLSRWDVPALSLYLLLVVTGVFTAYTYLGLLLQETTGPGSVAAGLATFGGFGLIGVTLASRHADRRMIRATAIMTAGFVAAAMIGEFAFVAWAPLIFVAVALWGTAYGALPTVSTTFFLHAGQHNPDQASSISVVIYQVGISAGSALGAVVVGAGAPVSGTLWLMAALTAGALAVATLWARPLLR